MNEATLEKAVRIPDTASERAVNLWRAEWADPDGYLAIFQVASG